MAKTYTNRGKYAQSQGTFGTATLKLVALKGTAPSAATIADYNFASDVIAGFSGGEGTASGYARPTITVTITEDDTNDRVTYAWGTVSLGTIATGDVYTGIACINNAGANDAAHECYWVDVLGTALTTNGSGVSYAGGTDTLA